MSHKSYKNEVLCCCLDIWRSCHLLLFLLTGSRREISSPTSPIRGSDGCSDLIYECLYMNASHLVPLGGGGLKIACFLLTLQSQQGADSLLLVFLEISNLHIFSPYFRVGPALHRGWWNIGRGSSSMPIGVCVGSQPQEEVRCSEYWGWLLGQLGGYAAPGVGGA